MKYLIYFFTVVLLFSLNVGVFSYFPIRGALPNLLLIFIVVIALLKEELPEIYFVAFLSGLFLDFSTGVFFGSFTLAFLLLSFLFSLVLERILSFEVNWKYVIAFLVVALFFVNACIFSYNWAAYHIGWAQFDIEIKVIRDQFLPAVFYNLLLLYPVYVVASKLRDFFASQQRKSFGR